MSNPSKQPPAPSEQATPPDDPPQLPSAIQDTGYPIPTSTEEPPPPPPPSGG